MTLSDNAFSSAANQAFPSAVDPQSLLVLGKAPPCAAAAKQQLIPPPQPGNYLPFFQEWSQQLRTSLEQSLPAMPAVPKEAFVAACQSVQSAVTSKQSAEKVRDDIEKVKPVDEAALADAKQAVADAETAAQHALDACQAVAVDTILDDPASPVQHILTNDLFDDADLVTYTVLMHATPVLLAQWCDNDPAHAQQLLAALHDVPLLRLFLESGGARNGRYGRAVELYHQINILHQLPAPPSLCSSSSHNNNPVLQRLALAVALELADPYKLFDQAVEQIDAVQRYVHYEQAFLLGELDPAFGQFNVWELRQVVNSDATEGELSLGRQSLINYRPDFCLSTDALWRYCIIVRTDVLYTTPDWYKSRKSYDQILSGGGKCGPRAWYGRFVCKAFGIPTWGVRQPGHAAMTRWTRNGWDVCLGGGLWKSWWEDRCGLDFLLETQARNACGSETAFAQKVLRLQWIASFWNEKESEVKRAGNPDPNSPWYSLGMMQRRRLAPQATNKLMFPPTEGSVRNKIAAMLEKQEAKTLILSEAVTHDTNSGAIVIPAASCCDPAKPTNKVLFLPSFMGGQQLFLKEDAEIEYCVPQSVLKGNVSKYRLTCRVATAHRKEEPILLTVGPSTVYTITMPYNMGLWEDTEPVIVELDSSTAKLRFARPNQLFGFSIKDIRLEPV